MRVRWTTIAAGDLAHIVDYIRKEDIAAARRVAQTIHGNVAGLRTFPHRGRIGLAENTRELVFAPWPYIAVYEIIGDQVQVSSYPSRRAGLALRTFPTRVGFCLAGRNSARDRCAKLAPGGVVNGDVSEQQSPAQDREVRNEISKLRWDASG